MSTGSVSWGRGVLALIVGALLTAQVNAQQVFWSTMGSGSNAGGIWTAVLDGSGAQPLFSGLNRPVGLIVHNSQLYWAEAGVAAGTSRIVRSNLDGSGLTVLFDEATHGFTDARMLAIHPGTGQIYWTDELSGVHRGNLDGTDFEILGGGASRYSALDIDTVNNHVFYGDPTNQGALHRMELDGTGDTIIAGPLVQENWDFNAISIDQATGHIYFNDYGTHTIKRIDSNGLNVVTISGATAPLGVSYFKGEIYWVGGGRLERIDADGMTWELLLSDYDILGGAFALTVIPEPAAAALCATSVAVLLLRRQQSFL